MQDPAFDPAQTVIISRDETDVLTVETPPAGQTIPPLPMERGLGGEVEISEYTDIRVALTVTSDAPGYLVLTDAYYPGWTATVNGEVTPIQRADVMFRAVSIPAGTSEVVFAYRPAWLTPALLIGGIAWLVALIGLILLRRRGS